MDIRTADRSDADTIRNLARQSFRRPDLVTPETGHRMLELRFGGDRLEHRLATGETVCVLAERDGTEVGFAEGSPDDATVDWLQVVPGQQGEGVGARLFERLDDELRDDRTPDSRPDPGSGTDSGTVR